ncbi:MAG: S1 RNA-binding domain-containing protein, partial [Phyllobacteriaceae bacterium]|nr:S1 RNA-binding domain-containing protein [Phyllobacteriaceae bacterium]
MGSKMLVDASHPEETRVVVARGSRIEEFDFESASRKPLKGNIYLAKVTRVEPSLQAAFVEYGGNRHGFLAFAEIHPDYYQIPVADRLALLKEQEEDDAAEAEEENGNGRDNDHGSDHGNAQQAHDDDHHDDDDHHGDHDHHDDEAHGEDDHGEDSSEAHDENRPDSTDVTEAGDGDDTSSSMAMTAD